jgi:hypothetical protein
LERASTTKTRPSPGCRLAFALVNLGKRGMGEFDPLRYL